MNTLRRLVHSEFVLPPLFFALTTFVFFRPHILGIAYFWEDFIEQEYPNRVYAARMLEQGELPHWNPYSFCGMPFQADVQSALYYPLHIPFDRLIGAHAPGGVYWLQLLIIVHFFIAQLAMYALARYFGISRAAALLSAVAYAFAAPLALHTQHRMFIEHLAWFPLLVLFVHRAVTTSSLAAIGWGGLVGGTMLLSGAPQMSLYMLSVCAVMALWWSIRLRAPMRQKLLSLAKGVATLGIAVALWGIQYFPSRQLAEHSERATFSYEQATEGSLEWANLLTAVVPKAYGVVMPPGQYNPTPYYLHPQPSYLYWDTAFYFGAGVLLLAVWAAIACWESALVQLLVVLSIAAVLFALGSNGPIYWLIYKLPFFGQVRIPARMMFVVSFSAALLAAVGWDALVTRTDKQSRRLLSIIAAAILAIAAGVGMGILTNPPTNAKAFQSSGWTQTLLIALVAVAALLRLRGVRSTLLTLAVVGVVFADLYSAHASFSQGRISARDEYRQAFPDELKAVLLPKPPDTLFRVSMRKGGILAMKRNQGLVDGIMLFEGYNQLLLKRRHPAVASPEQVADLLAIRWTIAPNEEGRWGFVQRATAFPMAWLVHRARVVAPDSVAPLMRNDTTINYHTEAVIEEELPFELGAPSPTDTVTIERYTPDEVRYRVRCQSPKLLVMSEIFYPAWRAYLDGQPTPLLRANYCLRAVTVPRGEHTVELRYEDPEFAKGALVTKAALAAAVALIILEQIRRLQRRTSAPPR